MEMCTVQHEFVAVRATKKADLGKQAVRGIPLLSQQCTGDMGYKQSIIIPEQKYGQCLGAEVRNSRNPGKTSK